MQRDKVYPHIASHDAALGINAAWLNCLTDANFKFSQWATTKAVCLNVVSLSLQADANCSLAGSSAWALHVK